MFTVRSLEALVSRAGTLCCVIGLTPQLFLPAYPNANIGPPVYRHLTQPCLWPCHRSSLPQLPVSTPPTSLDECFFFSSLVVGLPYSSMFWQFWLFWGFKLVVVLVWLCEEAKPNYLTVLLGWKLLPFFYIKLYSQVLRIRMWAYCMGWGHYSAYYNHQRTKGDIHVKYLTVPGTHIFLFPVP